MLSHIFERLKPLLFRWKPEDLKHWRDPPPEMFVPYGVDKIITQYTKVRRWIQDLLRSPDGAELFIAARFTIALDLGKECEARARDVQPQPGAGPKLAPRSPTT